MNFTRRLVRSLGDGQSIAVERVWRIKFLASTGFVVSGIQIAVEVSAPPSLNAFKRLEEEKVEKGMFPLQLTRDGMIAGGRAPMHQLAVQAAIDQAEQIIARYSGAPPPAKHFLNTIQNASAETMSQMPRDLFFPAHISTNRTRELNLPDGTAGRIDATFTARMSDQFGVFEQAERSITTTLGNQSRKSSEEWSLLSI